MYTDERVCEFCCDNSEENDGANFCKICQKYLCLECTQFHGQLCEHSRLISTEVNGNMHEAANTKDEKFQRIEELNSALRSENNSKTVYCQTGYNFNQTRPRTFDETAAFKDHEDKIRNKSAKATDHVQEGLSHYRVRDERIAGTDKQEDDREHSSVTDGKCRPSLKSGSSDSRRQTYSARGGYIQLGSSPEPIAAVVLQRCNIHPEANIENYCKKHDSLCCEECLIKEHNCCTVQPVDEIANGIREKKEFTKSIEEAKALQETYEEIITRYEKCLRLAEPGNNVDGKYEPRQVLTKEEIKKLLKRSRDVKENVRLWLSSIRRSLDSDSEMLIFITFHKNKHILMSAKDVLCDFIPISNVTSTSKSCLQENSAAGTGEDSISSSEDTENKDSAIAKSMHLSKGRQKAILIGDIVLENCTNGEDNGKRVLPYIDDYSDADENSSTDTESFTTENETSAKPSNSSSKSNSVSSKSGSPQPVSKKKNVLYSGRRNPDFPFHFPDKITTNGLVTEYYLSDNLDDSLKVLRLQSAPAEKTTKQSNAEKSRPVSMHNNHRIEMIQWQNRKILESVETKTEVKPATKEEYYEDLSRNISRKKFKNSSDFKKEETARNKKQINKQALLLQNRRDNALLLKTKSDSSRRKDRKQSFSTRSTSVSKLSEKQRLKFWIQKTEEMNRLLDERNGIKANPLGTYDTGCLHEATLKEMPVVHLTVKEATLIKAANRNERVWSAKSRASESEESRYKSQAYALRPKTELFLVEEQIVRMPEDKFTCEINSITCMPDGRIVVSDLNNQSIKMFRVGWGKASVLPLYEPPHAVAMILNTTLAVISGLAHNYLITVNVGQNLTVRRRFKTMCVCKDVASYESHIYLLCMYHYRTEVRVLTTDGIVRIRMDLGHNIPSPRKIALKPRDGLIYIADENDGVFSVQMGKIISRSFDRNIESYEDVAIDLNNTVFISTRNPGGVHELSFDGRHLMPIVLGYDIRNIKAIAYNAFNNSLIVGCSNTETVQIYKIHDTLVLRDK